MSRYFRYLRDFTVQRRAVELHSVADCGPACQNERIFLIWFHTQYQSCNFVRTVFPVLFSKKLSNCNIKEDLLVGLIKKRPVAATRFGKIIPEQ